MKNRATRKTLCLSHIFILICCLVFIIPRYSMAQQNGGIKGKITDNNSGDPLGGVNIFVMGTNQGTSSDYKDGTYKLELPAGDYTLRISFIGYNTVNKKVTVSSGQTLSLNVSMKPNLIGMDEAVVVGARRKNRTVIKSAVPIDVLNTQSIQATGLSETSQIIQSLAPSFNFPRPSVTDGTDAVRPATLRGLGPGELLVLVNGKRRYTSALVNVNGSVGRGEAGVDLNAIPASAIQRIEILRDGAAAQYGSDAISGVINIILKKDSGFTVSTKTGQTSKGDGKTIDGDINYGTSIGNGGYLNMTAEYRGRGSTNRAGIDPRQQYFGKDANGNPTFSGDPNQVSQDPREASFNRHNFHVGDPVSKNGNFMFNSSIPINGSTHFYTFGGLGYRDVKSGGFYRRALDNRDVRAIYPDGFLPLIHSTVFDGSVAVGVKGASSSGWAWDISNTYGHNSFNFGVDHSLNTSYGAKSQTKFNAGTLFLNENSLNLDLSKDYNISTSHKVSVAFGSEFRIDNYQIHAGEKASYADGGVKILDGPNQGQQPSIGSQVFPGFRPSDATNQSRNNFALYADVENNYIDKFLITAAGRFEHYNDFGSTLIGKATARYELNNVLALRGSFSNGFKAPQLQQAWYSTTATVFINGSPYEIRTFPVEGPGAKALGSKPLKPEKSVNFSGGFTLTPGDNFSMTVDYYHINIKDRVVLSSNFIGSSVQQLLDSRGLHGVTGGRYFTNAANTSTEGLDVVTHYGLSLGSSGILRLTGAFNINTTKITHIDKTPPQLASLNVKILDRSAQDLLTVAQPRTNVNITAAYTYKKLNLTLKNTRFGKVTNWSNNPANDQTFSAKWLTDLDASYAITNKVSFGLGAENLFNVYPDKVIDQNSYHGIFQYTGISPFGFNGAYYYARLTLNL
ncbi:MAG TPA: TonB-dependent receptor [Balneolales bacterium]|nr:TonB-dependent receptor [Balneolales bacterium]